ncbi:MAG: YiiX/YebB-like N1pC/P60 family cysteine hydrolase [Elusimicrobiota bacterium]|nr:YiiX/YebB-like N1pC/P60 family cysteine hydrolase [Elusimicrobiota bacterium]
MKRTIFLVTVLLLAGNAARGAAPRSELDADKEALLKEIISQSYASGTAFPKMSGAALQVELVRAVAAFAAGSAAKSTGFDSGGAYIKLINSVWALGEVGGADAEWVLRKALPSADRTVRLNIAAALDKIGSRSSGSPAASGLEAAAGHMEPGDILFRKGYFGILNSLIEAQTVGHVGVYAGLENGKHMVIEGWQPVRKVQLSTFVGDWPFYGNYTTSPRPTRPQRDMILEYASAQLGKGFDMSHVAQKGPAKFDCVGLAEAAYEAAGLNPTPDDFETGWGWPLTPTEQYEHTVPNF